MKEYTLIASNKQSEFLDSINLIQKDGWLIIPETFRMERSGFAMSFAIMAIRIAPSSKVNAPVAPTSPS